MLGLVMCAGSSLAGCAQQVPRVQVHQLSKVERARLERTYLMSEWAKLEEKYPKVVKPQVKLQRYVSLDEWAVEDAKCLSSLGFPATVNVDGGVSGAISPSQHEAEAVAQYACDVEFPLDPRFNRPLNDSQLQYLYSYFTGKLIPCLKKAGYSIRTPPSLQTFEDQYSTDKNWSPYDDVSVSGVVWSNLNQKCPQSPSGLYG